MGLLNDYLTFVNTQRNTGNVSGLLLYAKTEDEVFPDGEPFVIGGNSIEKFLSFHTVKLRELIIGKQLAVLNNLTLWDYITSLLALLL